MSEVGSVEWALERARAGRYAPAVILADEVEKLRHLVTHLFPMITDETWRATGGDDGQGHYEGDYHRDRLAERIRSWSPPIDHGSPHAEPYDVPPDPEPTVS